MTRATRSKPLCGFIDAEGRVAIEPAFELVRSFAEGLAFARLDGKWLLIGRDGRQLTEAVFDDALTFSEGLAPVCIGKRWGYAGRDGALVIEPRFAEAGPFCEGLAAVRLPGRPGKVGFVDPHGDLAVEARYDEARPFADGLAAVNVGCEVTAITRSFSIRTGGLWHFVRKDGERAFAQDFVSAESFREGWALVSPRGSAPRCYIDLQGSIALRPEVGFAETAFSCERARVQEQSVSGRSAQTAYGYIDRSGTLAIPTNYAFADEFREGLALVNRGGRQKQGELGGGTYAFVDPLGQQLCTLPAMDLVRPGLRCGRAAFHDAKGKVGFVGPEGTVVIEAQYAWTLGFSDGLCAVRG